MAQLVNRAGCTLLGYCLSCTNHSKHGIGASSHGADADAADPSIVSVRAPGRAHLIDAGELGSSPWQSREDPTEDGDQSLGAPLQGTFSSLPFWHLCVLGRGLTLRGVSRSVRRSGRPPSVRLVLLVSGARNGC